MKSFKFIGLYFFIAFLHACSSEVFDDNYSVGRDQSVALGISMDKIVPVNMNSRADTEDFNKILGNIHDLNIRVHKTDKSVVDFYCNGSTITQSGPVKGKKPVKNANVYYIDGKDLAAFATNRVTLMHCGDILAREVDYIEVIANKEADLHGVANWNTVKETGAVIDKNYCMMYGKIHGDASVVNTHNGLNCRIFNVQLKRTRAFVTVKIQDAGLNDNVVIYPVKVSLYNVPKECALTSLLSSSNKKNAISTIGESELQGQQHELRGEIGKGKGMLDHVGEHATATNIPTGFRPLYLFENLQGERKDLNPATASHITKYPDANWTVADAKNRDKNYRYSYVQVDARYRFKKGNEEIGGFVAYRFFLGNNANTNFDVEGNAYYKLTLNLKGFGGAKEDGKTTPDGKRLVINDTDASWRVDLDVNDFGFEKSNYEFDSHGLEGSVNVVGTNWELVKATGGGLTSWLTINTKSIPGLEWASPTTEGFKFNIVNGKIYFRVQPMMYGSGHLDPDGWFDEKTYTLSKPYREMKMVIKKTGGTAKDTMTVTVRQYCPIPVTYQVNMGGKPSNQTVFMERFEEYDPGILGFPWLYQGDNLAKSHNINGLNYNFKYGESLSINQVGENALYLNDKSSASYKCFDKGNNIGPIGAPVSYYVLPTQGMMKALLEYNHDPKYGPFEPIHRFEDYWTSTVLDAEKTATIYYDSQLMKFVSTKDRTLRKRIRAVYAPYRW